MRKLRFRTYVSDAPLSELAVVHSRHVAAADIADVELQQAFFFTRPGEPEMVWVCQGDCKWCDAVAKRYRREEDQHHRQRVAASTL